MRLSIHGPSIGPVHTTLWSSGRRSRRPAPYRGLRWLYFIAVGGIAWAYIDALWLGILVSVLAAAVVALGVYGAVSGRRETRRRPAAQDKPLGWKADHVPASAEYRKAHPEGPRDRASAS